MKDLLSKADLENLKQEINKRAEAEIKKRAAAAKADGERQTRIKDQKQEEADVRREVARPEEIAQIRDTLDDLRDQLDQAEARSDPELDTPQDTKEREDLRQRIGDLEEALDTYGDD